MTAAARAATSPLLSTDHRKKRRRRTWETTAAVVVSRLVVVLSATVLPAAVHGQGYYATCRGLLQSADANADKALALAEFNSFLSNISGGDAVMGAPDLPPKITEAYENAVDKKSKSMDISAAAGEAVDVFCKNIYLGLVDLFDVSVSNNQCIAALQAGDTQPQNGQMSTTEYIPFLNVLTVSQAYSAPFESLPTPFQTVFNDMATGGIIDGSKGTEYLIEFCQRTLLAAHASAATKTPTRAPAVAAAGGGGGGSTTIVPTLVSGTALPTITGSMINTPAGHGSGNSTLAPTLSPTSLSSGSGSNSTLVPTSVSSTLVPTAVLGEKSPVVDGSTGETTKPTAAGSLNEPLVPTPVPSAGGTVLVAPTAAEGSLNATLVPSAGGTLLDESPTIAPTRIPNATAETQASANATALSDAEFNSCKTALVVADIDRNNELQKNEFAAFVADLSADPQLTLRPAFSAIDKVYRDVYDDLTAQSQGGPPRLDGTRPGASATRKERANILNICQRTYQAIQQYEGDGPSGPANDASADTTDSDDEFDSFYPSCKDAMVVSDLNRNDILEEAEYVKFTNRLAPDIFKHATTFQKLDPVFRASYKEVSAGRGVSIYGTKPGQRTTRAHDDHLRAICKSTKKALDTIISRGDSIDSVDSPTPSPTVMSLGQSSITTDFFQQCKSAMLIADLDRDDALGQSEYVRLLNRLTMSRFAGAEFSDLDAVFQLSYYKVSVGGKVDVSGSKPGQTVNRSMKGHLKTVCEGVKESIDVFELTGGSHGEETAPAPLAPQPSRSPKQMPALFDAQNCALSIVTADLDANGRLTQDEYAGFIQAFREQGQAPYDELPFLLRENFQWLILRKSYIDVSSMSAFDVLSGGDDIRLQWMCDRTGKILSVLKEDESVSLDDHCAAVLRKSDTDSNQYVDQSEFISLLRGFSGAPLIGLEFQTVSIGYRNVFNAAKSNDNDMIDVETAAGSGLCFELQKATDAERGSEAFFEQCVASLRTADANSDESLSKEEYVPFLYNLAAAYGLIEEAPNGLEFQNLSEVLRLNYDVLSGQRDAVGINGTRTQPTEAEAAGLRWVCQNTEGVVDLINDADDSVATVFNAFYISNNQGLMADDLRSGANRDLLEAAYNEFVADQVGALTTPRHVRRYLVGEIVESSASVYQIDDAQCSSEMPKESLCQVVYGSFDLSLPDEKDIDAAATEYSETIQAAIDQGGLQLKLRLLDSSTVFEVDQSAEPVKPSSSQVFVPNHRPESSTAPVEDEEASLFLTLLSGALVSSAIFATLYYWFFYIRRGKTGFEKEKPLDADTDEVVFASYKPPEQTNASRSGDDEETGCGEGVLKKENSSEVIPVDGAKAVGSSDETSTAGNLDFRTSGFSSSSSRSSRSSQSSSTAGKSSQSSAKKEGVDSENSESSRSNGSSSSSESCGSPKGDSAGSEGSTTDSNIKSKDKAEVLSEDDAVVAKSKRSPDVPDDSNSNSRAAPETGSSPATSIVDPSVSDGDDNSQERSEESDNDESSSKAEESSLQPDIDDAPSVSESYANGNDEVELSHSASENNDDESISREEEEEDEELDQQEDDEEEGESGVDESNSGGEEADEGNQSASFDEADTLVHSTMSLNTRDVTAAYEKYRPIVEDLVRQVVPEEIGNVDTMMEQFIGRERELIRTLKNMAGIEVAEEDQSEFYSSDFSGSEDLSSDEDGEASYEVEESDDDDDDDERISRKS